MSGERRVRREAQRVRDRQRSDEVRTTPRRPDRTGPHRTHPHRPDRTGGANEGRRRRCSGMSAADDARMALAASHLRAVSPFDALRIVDEHGAERWSARALMVRLGYSRWENLSRPLERAKATMRNVSGEDAVTTTFLRSQKVADRAQGGGSPGEDWLLTREAAYLVAMNGDPNKSMR